MISLLLIVFDTNCQALSISIYLNLSLSLRDRDRADQGLAKGAEICLNPVLSWLAGEVDWLAVGSTLSMLKIKVKISETNYHSFYKTLELTL